jgi:hypothetical protein
MRIPRCPLRYCACVFALVVFLFWPLQAQHWASTASRSETAPTSQSSAASAPASTPTSKVTIFYTSQLFGYFRAPDLQPADSPEGCAATNGTESPAATAFDALWQDQTDPGKILVGTGNNLAPALWSRQFAPKPHDQYRGRNSNASSANLFERASKELFAWDPGDTSDAKDQNVKHWLTNEHIAEDGEYLWLLKKLQNGEGTIPTDNVACFLRRAGYAAIVPGKSDFYYGPERLRELARFLASPEEAGRFKPVEMLGANLVIETTWKSDHKPVGDSQDPPWFIPKFPTAKDIVASSHVDVQFLGLTDKGTVYPWFVGPTLQFARSAASAPLDGAIRNLKFDLCETTNETKDPKSPNTIPESFAPPLCRPLPLVLMPAPADASKVSYRLSFPPIDNDPLYQPTLKPGWNYGLCVDVPSAATTDSKGGHRFCVRFSVYTPFFQYPSVAPTCDGDLPCYRNPEPYALLKKEDHPGLDQDVAIFGAVDPNIGQEVGMLNFAWANSIGNGDDKKYKTKTVSEDPGEALNEIVAYFERRYKESHDNREFSGVRVLLAQMTPEEAQKLAARVGKFDAVVSDADPQLSGVGETRTATWNMTGPHKDDHHAFLAVPQPYWVSGGDPKEHVDLGELAIDIAGGGGRKTFTATHVFELDPSTVPVRAPGGFWQTAEGYINKRCGARFQPQAGTFDDILSDSDKQTVLQSLTACTMQQEIDADVVLIQKRDFYLDWQQRPDANLDGTPLKVQQFLDRIIWKGDFLTLSYVPGSTLQSVMKKSKEFDDDDKSLLSLSNEIGRGLVAFGIRQDSKSGGYLIDEVPLDPTRVYAVATSDFVDAGDTGYPDFASGAIRQVSTPLDVDKRLREISGIVCRRVEAQPQAPTATPTPENPSTSCMDSINRDDYFDALAVSPSDSREGDTWGPQLWEWSVLDPSKRVPGAKGKKDASDPPQGLETHVEQRPIGSARINAPDTSLFAINDAALSLNMLNHKFSDAGLAQTFVGNPTPQLSAKRSHAAGYDIQPKLLYSWHNYQVFQNAEMIYNVQYTGNQNQPRTVNQKENLFSSDAGFARDFEDRTLPHVEILGTFHYETQLWSPTPATLAPLPKGDTFAPGVNTSRTHYFLPRIGVRYVNRTSWIEAGMESGGELQAVRLIAPPPGGTVFGLSRPNVHVSGTYWKWHLVVPFGQKTTWTTDEDGDYFFNQGGDAKTDTRFRSDTKTALNFQVFPSLVFAPTYELFYYSNKVQGDWFWQNQASIQMKVRFDFWNRNRKWDQFKYKAASGSSQ